MPPTTFHRDPKYAWASIRRAAPPKRGAAERVEDFREIYQEFDERTVREQAARCFTGFAQRTSDGRLDEPDWGLHPWPAPAFQRGTPG